MLNVIAAFPAVTTSVPANPFSPLIETEFNVPPPANATHERTPAVVLDKIYPLVEGFPSAGSLALICPCTFPNICMIDWVLLRGVFEPNEYVDNTVLVLKYLPSKSVSLEDIP